MRGNPLQELVRPRDDVASVYLRLDSKDLQVRWRALAGTLASQGAPSPTLDALERLIARHRPGPQHLAAFAAGGRVVWDRAIVLQGVPHDRAAYGKPPLVTPLLSWFARHPAHVIVAIDRHGGDITAVAAGADAGTITTVIGPDDEITRGGPRRGDHPRIERRATQSWRHNAAAVASAAVTALKKVDARLLLVAGQPRIVKQMLEQMPHDPSVTVEHVPGGRAADGSNNARHGAVQQTIARIAGGLPDTTTGSWVWTVADTLNALACGQVGALVVADDPAEERVAWFGPELLCADVAGPGLVPGRLVDVAVRAALLTDADVHVAGPRQAGPDGIAALCRFG